MSDLNKYDELHKVISNMDGVQEILEQFSGIKRHDFKLLSNGILRDYLISCGICTSDNVDSFIEVLKNSKTLYDFEKIFPEGINKLRACTKYVSEFSEMIKDNIERTNFLTIDLYMVLHDIPEDVAFDIIKRKFNKFELLYACFLITLNIIDPSEKFDLFFDDKISEIASNVFKFVYS